MEFQVEVRTKLCQSGAPMPVLVQEKEDGRAHCVTHVLAQHPCCVSFLCLQWLLEILNLQTVLKVLVHDQLALLLLGFWQGSTSQQQSVVKQNCLPHGHGDKEKEKEEETWVYLVLSVAYLLQLD
jgi:hypothetical protein